MPSNAWEPVVRKEATVQSLSQAPALRRGANSSQVADPWIIPLTILHPPNASGGNMYLHWSQRVSGVDAGR
jgi:hypothetical protein